MKKIFLSTLLATVILPSCSKATNAEEQSGELPTQGRDTELTYVLDTPYDVETIVAPTGKKIKNVILMIGDGMSLNHIAAAWTANRGKLWVTNNAQTTGLSKTWCADKLITDSGAGGTAIATGEKTNYHSVGVDTLGNALPSLSNWAHDRGMANGVAVTCRLWDATPADFLCHTVDRDNEELVMGQYVDCIADVIIGPGTERMTNREDGRNLYEELAAKGFVTYNSLEQLDTLKPGRVFCCPFPHDVPLPSERGNWLERASLKAIDILNTNPNGFFLMIEGSQLDDYGHFNDLKTLMEETLDFDQTIGAVLKWAAMDGETLVIVTADHECGGLTVVDGDMKEGRVVGKFSTGGHSGTMVPVYAFGPGHEVFTGVFENTEISKKIKNLFNK